MITKFATCAQPYGPSASELGHGTCLAVHEFPAKLMKVTRLAHVFNPTETKKNGPRQKPGKHSSTVQRRTLHSSVRGAACHEPQASDARDGINTRSWQWFMARSRAIAQHQVASADVSREWPQPDVRAALKITARPSQQRVLGCGRSFLINGSARQSAVLRSSAIESARS